MKAVVAATTRTLGTSVTIEEIDISTDAALEARYGVEIPILTIDGKKVAKYRVSESDLRRMIRGRAE